VDTLGLLSAVVVAAANVDDAKAAHGKSNVPRPVGTEIRSRRMTTLRHSLVGLAIVAALAVGLVGASESRPNLLNQARLEVDGFRQLTEAEQTYWHVGGNGWICSQLTNPCPTTGSPRDLCVNGNGAPNVCAVATCYGCSIANNYRICDTQPEADCTTGNSPTGNCNQPGQQCGFMKEASCTYAGGICSCPGLPPSFSGDECADDNCCGTGA